LAAVRRTRRVGIESRLECPSPATTTLRRGLTSDSSPSRHLVSAGDYRSGLPHR
jgi:hypothetical protein